MINCCDHFLKIGSTQISLIIFSFASFDSSPSGLGDTGTFGISGGGVCRGGVCAGGVRAGGICAEVLVLI